MSQSGLFLRLASQPEVVQTASRIALLVGTLLVLINHGPTIAEGTMTLRSYLQAGLTYLVPYAVSTYSSVSVMLRQREERNTPE